MSLLLLFRRTPPASSISNIRVRHDGQWKAPVAISARHGGQWRQATLIEVRLDGEWRVVQST